MSDLEFFNPSDGGESYDPAAFERFKEKIKKSAAAMAAARKSEQKQKEKEDKLAKILLRFIQQNQKRGVLLLAARLLEENIPPSFILSIIILGNEDIKQEMQKHLQLESSEVPLTPIPTEFSLITRFTDESIPLRIKAEIDSWGKGMFDAGSAVPFRILETAIDKEGHIKKVVIDCTANVLDDFLAGSGAPSVAYDTCFSFCEFLMQAIMRSLRKQIENQKELR